MKRNAFGQIAYSPLVRFVNEPGDEGGGGDGDSAGKDGFTPPATQEELNRIIADRVARAERRAREDERGKLTPKPAEKPAEKEPAGEKPSGVSETDVDKRIQDALSAERLELAMERVSDRLDKQLEGRSFSASKLFGLDRSQFVKDDGKTVDDAKLADWVKQNSTEQAAPSRRLRGQGERGSSVSGGSVSAGRDLYDETHKKKSGKD